MSKDELQENIEREMIWQLSASNKALNDNLTATQTRCNELLEANRQLRAEVEQLRTIDKARGEWRHIDLDASPTTAETPRSVEGPTFMPTDRIVLQAEVRSLRDENRKLLEENRALRAGLLEDNDKLRPKVEVFESTVAFGSYAAQMKAKVEAVGGSMQALAGLPVRLQGAYLDMVDEGLRAKKPSASTQVLGEHDHGVPAGKATVESSTQGDWGVAGPSCMWSDAELLELGLLIEGFEIGRQSPTSASLNELLRLRKALRRAEAK